MEYSKKYLIERDIHLSTALKMIYAVGYMSHVSPGIKIKVKDPSAQETIEPTAVLQILASSHRFKKDSEVEVIVSGEFPQERLIKVTEYIGRLFSKDE